jgi:hypothetical protein
MSWETNCKIAVFQSLERDLQKEDRMMQKHLRMVVVPAMALGVFGGLSQAQVAARPTTGPKQAQATTATQVPAEFKSGIEALQSAMSSLEKAGDKWGGHRVKAMQLIDRALQQCGQPPTKVAAESGNTDEPEALQSGIEALNNAQSDFEKAGSQWGGRKAKAMSLIDDALQELQTGVEYAKSHDTY